MQYPADEYFLRDDYVGFTIAIYAIVCHFIDKPFQEIHLLYAVLIGCIAYLPVFIAEKKK